MSAVALGVCVKRYFLSVDTMGVCKKLIFSRTKLFCALVLWAFVKRKVLYALFTYVLSHVKKKKVYILIHLFIHLLLHILRVCGNLLCILCILYIIISMSPFSDCTLFRFNFLLVMNSVMVWTRNKLYVGTVRKIEFI